ncbi:MAG: hypothetical protein HY700_04085 [Gemmatimonadetes bacterium]|nr:hypothetical protein [Gemmatimonadota bacterium]
MPSSRDAVTARSLAAVAICLAPAACADRAPVHIRAFLPTGVPVAGLEVTALPFNPDRLLDSLALRAETPRPEFRDLEESVRGYRRPEKGAPQESSPAQWRAVRDSVVRLARELSRQDRRASGYRESYARFRQLYARYTAQEAERERQLRGLFADDRALAQRATRASDSLRAWEREAYRNFPALADERVARSGREVARTTTDSLGRADVHLANGDWWVTATVPDPDNPFEEYRWNAPVRMSAGLPLALPLIRANATQQWRH